jgi:hypothetical protein
MLNSAFALLNFLKGACCEREQHELVIQAKKST